MGKSKWRMLAEIPMLTKRSCLTRKILSVQKNKTVVQLLKKNKRKKKWNSGRKDRKKGKNVWRKVLKRRKLRQLRT